MKQSLFFVSLKSRSAIKTIFSNGRTLTIGCVFIRFIKVETISPPLHIVWVVSKKSGGAVLRNKVRRAAKAALFESMKEKIFANEVRIGYHISITIRPDFLALNFEQRVNLFDVMLKKLKLII